MPLESVLGPPRLNFYLNVLSYLPESTIVCNCADYKNFYTCNKDFINRRSIQDLLTKILLK